VQHIVAHQGTSWHNMAQHGRDGTSAKQTQHIELKKKETNYGLLGLKQRMIMAHNLDAIRAEKCVQVLDQLMCR